MGIGAGLRPGLLVYWKPLRGYFHGFTVSRSYGLTIKKRFNTFWEWYCLWHSSAVAEAAMDSKVLMASLWLSNPEVLLARVAICWCDI